MSYEGYSEYLCVNGHAAIYDCYEDVPTSCSCGAKWGWRHGVDLTNGVEYESYDENGEPVGDPFNYTVPAPVEEIGFDDVWQTDHYGNRYSVKRLRFKPLMHWRKIPETTP